MKFEGTADELETLRVFGVAGFGVKLGFIGFRLGG